MESSFDKSFHQRLHQADIPVTPSDWADMERLLAEQQQPALPKSSGRYALVALLTSCLLLGSGRFFSPAIQPAGIAFPGVVYEKKQLTDLRQSTSNNSPEQPSNKSITRVQRYTPAASYGLPEEKTADEGADASTGAGYVLATEAAEAMHPRPAVLSNEQHPDATQQPTANPSLRSFVRRRSTRIQWAVAAQSTWEAGLHNGQVSSRPAHRSGILVQLSVGKYTEFSSGLLAGQASIAGRYTSSTSGQAVTYRNQLSECVIPLGVTFIPVQNGRLALTLGAGINQHVKLSEEIRIEDAEGQGTEWKNTFQPEPIPVNQAAKSDLPGVRDMVLGNTGRYYVSGWISSGMRVRLSSIISLNAGITGTLRPGLKGISGNVWGVGGQLGLIARF